MIALLRKAVDLGVTFFDTAEVYGPFSSLPFADTNAFRSGRNFSAWIGLVPKQHSSGGKNRLSSISKQGDRYLRGLFVIGALAVIRYVKIHGTKHRPWLTALLARKPAKVAAIALANKIARMVWAMMARGERYKEPVALAA
jgi:transposase